MEQVLDNVSNTNMSEESVRKALGALNIKPTNQRIELDPSSLNCFDFNSKFELNWIDLDSDLHWFELN